MCVLCAILFYSDKAYAVHVYKILVFIAAFLSSGHLHDVWICGKLMFVRPTGSLTAALLFVLF